METAESHKIRVDPARRFKPDRPSCVQSQKVISMIRPPSSPYRIDRADSQRPITRTHLMRTRFYLLMLAFIAFISLGLPDALLGIAWPFMRVDLNQPLAANGIIVLAATLGAALSGFFSARMGRWLGIGRLLSLSCLLTGTALLGYTLAPSLAWIAVASAVIGLAAGATDATINGYIAKNFSAGLMQWLHASFGVGITLGPVVMTWVLVHEYDWRLGYQIHSVIQLLLMILFLVTAGLWLVVQRAPAEGAAEAVSHAADAHNTGMLESFGHVRVWLSMGLFFCYTGLEFSMGLWTFSLLTDVRGMSTAQAGAWVSVYWGMFTVGRIVMGFVSSRISQNQLMTLSLFLALVGALGYALNLSLLTNLLALVVIGFAYAPMYPALVSDTLNRVGSRHFNNAIGLQVTAASLGIAILPGSIGLLVTQFSLALFPWLLLCLTTLLVGLYLIAHRLGNSD